MRHKVRIQTEILVADGQGGFTSSGWTDGNTVSASVTPKKGYERFQAGQMQTPTTHQVVMRYRSEVTTANRLLFGTRSFEIKEVINLEERNKFLIIKAIERT